MALTGLGQLPHGLSLEGHLVRTVHDAVQDSVGQGWLIQPCMPRCHRQLAGDERGATAHPVIQQLQQVIALVRSDGGNGEVI